MTHLWNDLLCVEWDIKSHTLTQLLSQPHRFTVVWPLTRLYLLVTEAHMCVYASCWELLNTSEADRAVKAVLAGFSATATVGVSLGLHAQYWYALWLAPERTILQFGSALPQTSQMASRSGPRKTERGMDTPIFETWLCTCQDCKSESLTFRLSGDIHHRSPNVLL